MKKNLGNEVRGIVFLLVACLIWGIYVLNAEAAATDVSPQWELFDGMGNKVDNEGTAVIGNFTVKCTVELPPGEASKGITINSLTLNFVPYNSASSNLSWEVNGDKVIFKVNLSYLSERRETTWFDGVDFDCGGQQYRSRVSGGYLAFQVIKPQVSVTMDDQYVTDSSAFPDVEVDGKTWDRNWTGYDYDKTYYSISEDGSEQEDNYLNTAGPHRVKVSVYFENEDNVIGTAFDDFDVLRYERVVTGFKVTGFREGSGESLIIEPGVNHVGETYGEIEYPVDSPAATPSVSYKLQEEGDGAYRTEEPTAAGSYVACLSYPETDRYEAFSTTTTFTILPAYGYALRIVVPDITVGETLSPQVTDGENDLNVPEVSCIVEYRNSEGGVYSTLEPDEAGNYDARVTLNWYSNPTASPVVETATTTFKISKLSGSGSIAINNIRANSGVNVNPVVTSATNGTSNVTIEYKQAGAADAAYSQGVPTAVGSYRARATFAATDRYEEVIAYTDFEILPAYGYALKIQVADVKAGEKPSPVVTDGENNLENNSEVKYVVEYKVNGAVDAAYSATAPTAGGTYVARVSLYNSGGTLLKTATTTFKIGKQSGNGTITVESIRYGTGTVKPVVASETNGTGNVRVEYKLAEASDSTYSTTVPTIPGKYSARAIFAATDQYEEVVAVTKFEIYKGYGTVTVSTKDIYYGMEVDVKAITNVSNAGTAVWEYKQTGAEDSTYSTTVPTEIGSYTVRATYPESAYYFSFYATGKFEITYMPTPEFVLNGTTGKNEYFTSDVVVTTQPGYLICGSLDGDYASSLSLSDGNTVSYLYFMEEATGAKSAGVSTAGIKIDTISPRFSNLPMADVLYSDTWTTTISDLHLASVMLNGEKQDVNGNSLRLELDAEGGQKELELVATDDAGNTEKLVFTLAATWLEEKEIPVGQAVTLEAGTAYQLGEGTWQIDNDSTAYAGGSTVYIRAEGQYVFSNN